MSVNWKNILPTVFGALSAIGGVAAQGKIAALNSAAQTAVKAAVTKVDDGIDHLVSAYNSWDEKNPVAAEAITGTIGVLKGLGLSVPSVDTVQIHVKAAIADLVGILVPVSSATTSTVSTPVPAASGNETATTTPAS